MSEDWVEIVPPLPREEAERRLAEIRKIRPINDAEIRRDLINQGPGKDCLVRYLVALTR